jgi:BolA protein
MSEEGCGMVSVKSDMERKLASAFQPESLSVIDESHLHVGHAGARPGGETHFRVRIVAPAFAGRSRLDRHRLVNAALAEELAGTVHALVIDASAPGEPQRG